MRIGCRPSTSDLKAQGHHSHAKVLRVPLSATWKQSSPLRPARHHSADHPPRIPKYQQQRPGSHVPSRSSSFPSGGERAAGLLTDEDFWQHFGGPEADVRGWESEEIMMSSPGMEPRKWNLEAQEMSSLMQFI